MPLVDETTDGIKSPTDYRWMTMPLNDETTNNIKPPIDYLWMTMPLNDETTNDIQPPTDYQWMTMPLNDETTNSNKLIIEDHQTATPQDDETISSNQENCNPNVIINTTTNDENISKISTRKVSKRRNKKKNKKKNVRKSYKQPEKIPRRKNWSVCKGVKKMKFRDLDPFIIAEIRNNVIVKPISRARDRKDPNKSRRKHTRDFFLQIKGRRVAVSSKVFRENYKITEHLLRKCLSDQLF